MMKTKILKFAKKLEDSHLCDFLTANLLQVTSLAGSYSSMSR